MSIEWKVAEKVLDLFKILFTRRKASDVLKDAVAIRKVAGDIVSTDLSIDCFLLVMVHNGTGKLIPHGFKYWTILDGDYNDFLMSRFKMENYRNVIMDLDYANLFLKVKENKVYDTRPENMPAGLMRTNYTFEKLRFARWYFIKETRNAMWFILAGTTAPNESFDSELQQHRLNVDVNAIKNIIKKY